MYIPNIRHDLGYTGPPTHPQSVISGRTDLIVTEIQFIFPLQAQVTSNT